MKSIAWIGGIAAAGLLAGYSLHLAAKSSAPPAAPAVAAVDPTAAGNSGGAQGAYQVGDHLQQSPDLDKSPYKPSSKSVDGYREIAWESLIPKDWDPMAPLKGLKLNSMQDDDPRAMEALLKAKKYWKDAPIDPKMDGAAIRIPGFVVSLEREGDALKEFLLVPYFGACIHVPPPPANQIIHVRSDKAVKGIRTMDAVWISGVLKVERSQTMMGNAGYSMTSIKVEPYTDKADS